MFEYKSCLFGISEFIINKHIYCCISTMYLEAENVQKYSVITERISEEQ